MLLISRRPQYEFCHLCGRKFRPHPFNGNLIHLEAVHPLEYRRFIERDKRRKRREKVPGSGRKKMMKTP